MDIINSIQDKELKAAIQAARTRKRGRPKKSTTFNGIPDGQTQVCIKLASDKMDKIREISYLETRLIRDIIEEGIDYIIGKYESEHGTIVPDESHHINTRKK